MNTDNTQPKGNAQCCADSFAVTEVDDLGREFGYCSVCSRDMQDLHNGKGALSYNTHKRAKGNAVFYECDASKPTTMFCSELRDILNLPSTDNDKGLVIHEIKQLKAELERVKAERDELLAACKLTQFSFEHERNHGLGYASALNMFLKAKRAAKLAIANAEREGGKQ